MDRSVGAAWWCRPFALPMAALSVACSNPVLPTDSGPLDCGAAAEAHGIQIRCITVACEGGTQTCCGTRSPTCGNAWECRDRGADTSDCDVTVECLGLVGQCPSGWGCCFDGISSRCL